MRLTGQEALARLSGHDHGVLSTLHADRGIDAVPVVYAVADGHLGIPVDEVKPKASQRLQRVRNLRADPRATVLVEHWDPVDWSALWWVRAHLRWEGEDHPQAEALAAALASKYPQYRDRPFSSVIVLRIGEVTGWTAAT